FAIGFGELDHAILLDTNTLKYEMVPVKLDGYAIVIMNTNKRRELQNYFCLIRTDYSCRT
ncbi:hypothetical protein EFP6CTSP_21190, partial [Enterococcus faecium]